MPGFADILECAPAGPALSSTELPRVTDNQPSKKDVAALSEVATACSEDSTYEPALVNDIGSLMRKDAGRILWCWWPRSSRWTEEELVERSTRAVSACAASDVIALPDLPVVRALAEHWGLGLYDEQPLRGDQIIWYDPLLDDDQVDRAFSTLAFVLEAFGPSAGAAISHMYLDDRVHAAAAAKGLVCLGDRDGHAVVGSLREAKGFLHPSLGDPARPCLGMVLRGGDVGQDVRGPRGFCCETAAEVREALRRLRADGLLALVLKPAAGSGGEGVVLNASDADVEATARRYEEAEAELGPTILEELVGSKGQPSPTVYMVGSEVTVVADQLLTPAGVNLGNCSPAQQVDEETVRKMSRACTDLGTYLQLHGQWGADFVIDDAGVPILVDLNMGRPNGSLSYYCWRSYQVSDCKATGMALICSMFTPPRCSTIRAAHALLERHGLLYDKVAGRGVVLAQYMPGAASSVLFASTAGAKDVEQLYKKFLAVCDQDFY